MDILKVKEYKMIVHLENNEFGNANNFNEKINNHIKKGWCLFGKTKIDVDGGYVFYSQAMILLVDESAAENG